MLPSVAATEEIRRCVRVALRAEGGEPVHRPWQGVVGQIDFQNAARRQRVEQLLLGQSEVLDLPEGIRAHLESVTARERFTAMALSRETVRLDELLRRGGLRALMIKGPCLAVQTTGDLAARGDGDIDVLVHSDDVVAAYELLTANGWKPDPNLPVPGPSWGWRHLRRVGYEIAFEPPKTHGWPVDLHWQLEPARRGTPHFEAAWSTRAHVLLGESEVATIGVPEAFAHTCGHAAKDSWGTLRSLVDVYRLSRLEESWHRPLRRVDLMTLAATEATIGLPPEVPPDVRDRLRHGPSAPSRIARAVQARPVYDPSRFPLVGLLDALRRATRSSRAASDFFRLAIGTMVSPRDLGAVDHRHAVTAVPIAVTHTARRTPGRLASWWCSRD